MKTGSGVKLKADFDKIYKALVILSIRLKISFIFYTNVY